MSYRHGEFTWLENITPDVDVSIAFYTGLFGWTIAPEEMPGGMVYNVVEADGAPIGGIINPPMPQGAPKPPPHWVQYLSVPDVDAAVTAVEGAGGSRAFDPMDVPDVGRMALVMDAEGAPLFLWKGQTEDPPHRDAPGDVHWRELWSPDPRKALAFYEQALGLGHETMPMPDGPYHILGSAPDARPAGGAMEHPQSGAAAWLAYVHVVDVDATAAKVESLSGSVVTPIMEVEGVGRFFVLADPQGAELGVITPDPNKG